MFKRIFMKKKSRTFLYILAIGMGLTLVACGGGGGGGGGVVPTGDGTSGGTLESPKVLNYPTDFSHSGSMANDSTGGFYKVNGLGAGQEYVVSLATSQSVTVTAFSNIDFTGYGCSAWVSDMPGIACVATANSAGELYMLTSFTSVELSGATYSLDVVLAAHEGTQDSPIDISAQLPLSGDIPIGYNSYYEITNLTVGHSYTVNLTGITGDSDLYLYQDAYLNTACSSSSFSSTTRSCTMTASGTSLHVKINADKDSTFTFDYTDNGPAPVFTPEGNNSGGEIALTLAVVHSGEVDDTSSYYHISGLTPGEQYRTIAYNHVDDNVDLYVYTASDFTSLGCSSTNARGTADKCLATAPGTGELWIKVDGSRAYQYLGANYDLVVYKYFPNEGTSIDEVPLTFSDFPSYSGSVDTASYYLVTGLEINTDYFVDITGYSGPLSFSLAKNYNWLPSCYSDEISAGHSTCIITTTDLGTIAIDVDSNSTQQGTAFSMDLTLSPFQSEGTVNMPVALDMGGGLLPYTGQVGGSPSYYQISGVSAGQAHTVTVDGLVYGQDFYIYTDGALLGSTSYTNYACRGNSSSKTCNVEATAGSLWIMVDDDGVATGSQYSIDAALSVYQAEGSLPTPVTLNFASADLPHSGTVSAGGSYYNLTGVNPGTTYLLSASNATDAANLYVYSTLANFGSTTSGEYDCLVYPESGQDRSCAVTASDTSLWIMMGAKEYNEGAAYQLDAEVKRNSEGSFNTPVPLTYGTGDLPYSGEVFTDQSYYKIEGLLPEKLYYVRLTNLNNDVDLATDKKEFPWDSCSSVNTGTTAEECLNHSDSTGALYVDVTGSKTLNGGNFTIEVSPGPMPEGTSSSPHVLAYGTDIPHGGQVGSRSYYKVTGLAANTLYEVKLTSITGFTNLYVTDNTFDTNNYLCSSTNYDTDERCGGEADNFGELYVVASGSEEGATFNLEVTLAPQSEGTVASPWSLAYGPADLPHSGSVDFGPSYYKVSNLDPGATYTVSKNNQSDRVEVSVFDNAEFLTPSECWISTSSTSCQATTANGGPAGSSALYIKASDYNTVAGATFDLNVQ
ncbi:MAG: hypothetical protein ABFS18_07190 [Thermodesulfobacteriota bacterium]